MSWLTARYGQAYNKLLTRRKKSSSWEPGKPRLRPRCVCKKKGLQQTSLWKCKTWKKRKGQNVSLVRKATRPSLAIFSACMYSRNDSALKTGTANAADLRHKDTRQWPIATLFTISVIKKLPESKERSSHRFANGRAPRLVTTWHFVTTCSQSLVEPSSVELTQAS